MVMMNKFRAFFRENIWKGYKKYISLGLSLVFMAIVAVVLLMTYKKNDGTTVLPNILSGTKVQTASISPIRTTPKASPSRTSSTNGSQANSSNSNSSSNSSSGSDDNNSSSAESVSAFVAFYADSQSDSDEEDGRHLTVVDHILATGANPIFHAGDVMEDGTQNSLDRFNNIAANLLSSRSFYAALGNNDRSGTNPSPLFLGNFSFPNNERWYSVNSGNLHLVVLDSAFGSGSAEQLSWLESDLQSEASQSRITGVMYHHPDFTGTINSYLVNNGVDFVVCGHVHSYSKSVSDGITYFTLSGGGSMGYATATIYSSYAKFYNYTTDGSLTESSTINNR